MLRKLILLIFSIFFMSCSSTRTIRDSYEKEEVIRQVIYTFSGDIILLGDNYDYLFTGKEAMKLLTLIDFLKTEGLTSKNLSQIEKTLRVSEIGTARLQVRTDFEFYKKSKNDKDFEKKQEIFIKDLKRKLEEKNIGFTVKEDDRSWKFKISNVIDVMGNVAKLENRNEILHETKRQLINLKIDLIVTYEKELEKKSFNDTMSDFGESVKDGAISVLGGTVAILTAPVWVPFLAVYTVLTLPVLFMATTPPSYKMLKGE